MTVLATAVLVFRCGLAAIPTGTLAEHELNTGQETSNATELIAALRDQDPEARARAACELRNLGDRAAGAADALAVLLSDGSPVARAACERWWRRGNSDHQTTVGEIAASALVAIGSASFATLETALKSASWIARRNAAWSLGALDENRAVPRLIEATRDREAPVREQATWALGAIGHRDAVPALIDALKDDAAGVREQAAWALGALDDSRAVAGLLKTLRDADAGVREQSAWALGAIGDQQAVNELLVALKDRHAGVRRQAAWALGVISK